MRLARVIRRVGMEWFPSSGPGRPNRDSDIAGECITHQEEDSVAEPQEVGGR